MTFHNVKSTILCLQVSNHMLLICSTRNTSYWASEQHKQPCHVTLLNSIIKLVKGCNAPPELNNMNGCVKDLDRSLQEFLNFSH